MKLLAVAIILAVFFAIYPHINYEYPLHRDEWDRIALSKAIIKAESTTFVDPFFNETIYKSHLEIGFILWVTVLKLITGLDYFTIYRFFPAFLFALMIVSTYIYTRRAESSLIVATIPTTVKLLGFAFLVPVALCLIFIPLALKYYRNIYFLTIISTFLLHAHPPTAVALFIILLITFSIEREKKILYAITISSIISLPQFIPLIKAKGIETISFSTFIPLYHIYNEFGIVQTVFFVLGAYLILRERKREAYLVYAVIVMLVLNLIYHRYGFTFLIMPERNYLYMMLLMSIIGGYFLYKTKKYKLLYSALIILLISYSFYNNLSTPYYHIIDKREYEDFIFIKENLKGKAIIDPWKAIAFVAIAEKPVYISVSAGPSKKFQERAPKVYEFFKNKCRNTSFLIENNITIVYSYVPCENKDLIKIRERIYVLRRKR